MAARGHDPSLSPAGEVHHSRRRQRYASPGSQTARTRKGVLAWTSPASQCEEDGLKSATPRTNGASAGGGGGKRGITEV